MSVHETNVTHALSNCLMRIVQDLSTVPQCFGRNGYRYSRTSSHCRSINYLSRPFHYSKSERLTVPRCGRRQSQASPPSSMHRTDPLARPRDHHYPWPHCSFETAGESEGAEEGLEGLNVWYVLMLRHLSPLQILCANSIPCAAGIVRESANAPPASFG